MTTPGNLWFEVRFEIGMLGRVRILEEGNIGEPPGGGGLGPGRGAGAGKQPRRGEGTQVASS